MPQYIIEKQKKPPVVLAWIALILMTSNIYHTRLMILFGMYSEGATVVMQAVAVGCLFAYLLLGKGLRLGQVRLRLTDVLMILSLAVVAAFTTNWQGNLTYIIRYGVYVLIVILLKYDEKLTHIAFWCILAAGLLHILFTIWFPLDMDFYLKNIYPSFTPAQQKQLYGQMLYNGYSAGIAVHYSVNGMYMAITLCCTYALLLTARKKTAALVLFMINLLALIMTGKRGAMVFVVFAMLWAYMLWSKRAFGDKVLCVLVGVAAGALALYLLGFYNESVAATFTRWERTLWGNDNADVSNGRFQLYRVAWDLFMKHPLTGIGWREFTNQMQLYNGGSSQLMDTHNVFLQLLCETGIVGCGVFTALFATAYCTALKQLSRELSAKQRRLLLFSLCYQTFFLCYCLTGNPLYDHETLFAYIISVAAVGVLDAQNKPFAVGSKYINAFPEEDYATNGIGDHTGL